MTITVRQISMLTKINQLPGPLRAVIWLNIVIGSLALVGGVAILSTDFSDALVSLASGAISFLIIAGILGRSKVVRTLVLVFAWLGIVIYGAIGIVALFTMGLGAVVAVIPLGINILTVWGITAAPSRQYFGIGTRDPPIMTRDWMGNDTRT